jgi:hypothetical protein
VTMVNMESAKTIAFNPLKVLAGIAAVVGLLVVGFYGWLEWKCWGPNDKIHKCLMPGSYSIYLQPGEYGGWIFTTWESKQVMTSQVLTSTPMKQVSITGPAEVTTERVGNDIDVSYSGRYGWLDFRFHINKAGVYNFSSIKESPRLVFVIVPESERYFGLGSSFMFDGVDGDFNFDNVQGH